MSFLLILEKASCFLLLFYIRAVISQNYFKQSEVVTVLAMEDANSISSASRTNCPFLWPNLSPFPSVVNGQDVSVTGSVILKAASIPSNIVLNRITVQNTGILIFDDDTFSLNVREIYIMAGGKLYIGSETCRINNFINIMFHGSFLDSSILDTITGTTSKGLISEGSVDMHGKLFLPTWTRLAATAVAGTSVVYIQQLANWEVGQQIVLTTTVYYDCSDQFMNYCENKKQQNEVRTIAAVAMDTTLKSYAITIDQPLLYNHYAGIEYQGEVALLSRRVTVQGSQSNDNYGGHMKVKGTTSQGRFSGVATVNMGQLNILGRYPFHFHMMGNSVGAQNSYFQDCAVLNSQFRCYTVHGTNSTRLSRNVAFNVTGMCYYLEDGVEENNLFEYNLAAHVTPIYRPANGGWGQGGETFSAIPGKLLIPADTSAGGYYISNAMNSFIGNAASGGWTGFAFPNVAEPLGNYKGTMFPNNTFLPMHRPLKKFYGNTAHSAGFYWTGHGTCIYVGAWLSYDKTGTLVYNSGRNSRNTMFPNGTVTFMLFEQTKVFLCNTGVGHWGNNAHLNAAEMHDCALGAFFFGSSVLHNGLINTLSNNPNNAIRYIDVYYGWYGIFTKVGFQFYDTYVQTILSNVTFRHFHSAPRGDCAVRYMDHSDHYTPQGINSVVNLRFQDVDANAVVCIQNCGRQCNPATNVSSMSSRMYSVWDVDGSLSGRGVPTILGSNLDWWNWDDSCAFNHDTLLWSCPWKLSYWGIGATVQNSFKTGLPTTIPDRTVVFVTPMVGNLLSQGCDYTLFSTCTDQYAPYTVGRMSQWGKPPTSNGINLSPWAGVSGIGNSGWYWRVRSAPYGIDGAPSAFNFGYFYQMAAGSFLVVAVAYPSAAQFTVTIDYWGNTLPAIPMSATLLDVLSPTENVWPASQQDCTYTNWWEWYYMCKSSGSSGFRWFFDGKHLYLRLVPYNCYNRMSSVRKQCFSNYFNSYGAKVWNIHSGFRLSVAATCVGCTVQSIVDGVTYYTVADTAPAKTFESYSAPTTSPTSLSPTVQPVKSTPTAAPIKSYQPSAVPTLKLSPSVQPSSAPTALRTHSPTLSPSTMPSAASTILPTFIPTISPSSDPSTAPTTRPAPLPTTSPSSGPSPVPTARPTATSPTSGPSPVPTARPTTTSPTSGPSPVPTARPTTTSPTSGPSPVPTAWPTALPTTGPTPVPTARPTTTSPSYSPSRVPTARPTALPTTGPSRVPTARPTTTSPSYSPTSVPTKRPTVRPTIPPITLSPTTKPSTTPSKSPTKKPSTAQPA